MSTVDGYHATAKSHIERLIDTGFVCILTICVIRFISEDGGAPGGCTVNGGKGKNREMESRLESY